MSPQTKNFVTKCHQSYAFDTIFHQNAKLSYLSFYSESIPNEGQRSKGKNFGKQTVECFVYDEEGCKGTVHQSEALANHNASLDSEMNH